MSDRRPPTPEEVARLKRLEGEPDWSKEDVQWWMEMDKVIVWDVEVPREDP